MLELIRIMKRKGGTKGISCNIWRKSRNEREKKTRGRGNGSRIMTMQQQLFKCDEQLRPLTG